MTAPGTEPTVIEVDTPRVDGVITLHALAGKLRAVAGEHAAGLAPESTDPDLGDRLRRVSELAGQLADELARLADHRSSG